MERRQNGGAPGGQGGQDRVGPVRRTEHSLHPRDGEFRGPARICANRRSVPVPGVISRLPAAFLAVAFGQKVCYIEGERAGAVRVGAGSEPNFWLTLSLNLVLMTTDGGSSQSCS